MDYYAHESAYVDDGAEIGPGTKIWHFCHIRSTASVGRDCTLGQNVYIGDGVTIGDRVKVQNNVSVQTGVTIEDDVFLGPSCVFTNVSVPRSFICRHDAFEPTLVKRGASVGANVTVVCGCSLGRYSFVGAGATVTRDIPDFAMVYGCPARPVAYVSKRGCRLCGFDEAKEGATYTCPESGDRYTLQDGIFRECDGIH